MPWQLRDLATEPAYAQVKAELTARLEAWTTETYDPVLSGAVDTAPRLVPGTPGRKDTKHDE